MSINESLIIRNKLSKIDTSNLPFNIILNLVKTRNVPDYLTPDKNIAFCIQLTAYVKSIECGSWIKLYSYLPLPIDKYDTVEYEAFVFVQWFCVHEIAELFKYDNKQLLNPHDDKYSNEKVIGAMRYIYR